MSISFIKNRCCPTSHKALFQWDYQHLIFYKRKKGHVAARHLFLRPISAIQLLFCFSYVYSLAIRKTKSWMAVMVVQENAWDVRCVFPNGLSGFTSASPSPFADFLLFSFVKEKERQGEAAERIQAAIRRKQTTSGQPRFPVFLYFPSDVYIFPTAVSRHGKIRPKESRKTNLGTFPLDIFNHSEVSPKENVQRK